jgi:hypothetical protein
MGSNQILFKSLWQAPTFSENVHFGVNFDPKMAAKRAKMRIFEKFKKEQRYTPLSDHLTP